MRQFNDRLKNLNNSTKGNCVQTLIKKAHEEYASKLYQIYDKKEKELIKIKTIYGQELYKLSLKKDDEKEQIKVERKENSIKVIEKDKVCIDKNLLTPKKKEIKKSMLYL